MRRLLILFSVVWMLGVGSAHAAEPINEAGTQTGAGLLTYQESGAGNGGTRSILWTISGDVHVPLAGPGSGPFIGIRLVYAMDFDGEEHWKDPTQTNDFAVRLFWPELRFGYRLADSSAKKWAIDPYTFIAYRWQWFSRSNFIVSGTPVFSDTVTETFRLPEGGAGAKARLALTDRVSLYLGGAYSRMFEGRVANSAYAGVIVPTEGNHIAGDGGIAYWINPQTSLAIGYAYDQIILKSDTEKGIVFPNSRTKMSYGYLRLSQVF